jgi:hypothetical protein
MPKLNHPSLTQFSSEWFPQSQQQKTPYVPGQTPTAEQEALQEPAIDPVVLAAGGVAGGLENVMNKPMGNMAGKIVSHGMGSLRYEMEPSLMRMVQNFGQGAWNTGKSGALVQAINNYLLPKHQEAGKAASLPVGNKLVNSADRLSDTARREQIGGKSPPSIVDKFGKPIFDESGKMIPWSEAEKAPSKAATKINWTNVGDMLKKLMGDIGEVE